MPNTVGEPSPEAVKEVVVATGCKPLRAKTYLNRNDNDVAKAIKLYREHHSTTVRVIVHIIFYAQKDGSFAISSQAQIVRRAFLSLSPLFSFLLYDSLNNFASFPPSFGANNNSYP